MIGPSASASKTSTSGGCAGSFGGSVTAPNCAKCWPVIMVMQSFFNSFFSTMRFDVGFVPSIVMPEAASACASFWS
jgi:hypothetical protein